MNKLQLSELLDKYAKGTCAPEEIEAINKWFDQYQDSPGYTNTLPDDERESIKARMRAGISAKAQIEEGPSAVIKPMYRKWWLAVAAAAVILVFVKVLFLNTAVKSGQPSQLAIADLQITNHTKNIIKQVLPDNSVVWLSPGANLSWPKQFQAHTRNVAMIGECFFEVTKNPKRPFIIISEHIVTKVWGTSFRILDGADVTAARVAVLTGKVSVSKKGSIGAKAGAQLTADEILLYPKQEVVLAKNNTQLVASKQADVSDLNLYKHIDLSFERTKLTDIVAILNKKFDVNIKIQDEELDKAVMTADLTDLNLPEVLEVLKASMKLDYEVANDLIVLKKTN